MKEGGQSSSIKQMRFEHRRECVVYALLSRVLLFCNPMDYSAPGSSVHGILQARRLEWVAISFSRGSFWPKNQTHVSCIAGRFFTTEPPGKPEMWIAPNNKNILVKQTQAEKNSKWEVPEDVMGLVCQRNRKEASVTKG